VISAVLGDTHSEKPFCASSRSSNARFRSMPRLMIGGHPSYADELPRGVAEARRELD